MKVAYNYSIGNRNQGVSLSSLPSKGEYKSVFSEEEQKYVREHRLIMEKHLGRKLGIFEIVHHKDKNKSNNNLCNLEILSPEEHSSIHHAGSKRPRGKDYTPVNKLTDKKIMKIIKLHMEGNKNSVIARRMKISSQVVKKYLKENESDINKWKSRWKKL